MVTATEVNLDEALALRYAADLFHRALLEAGEPIKASEAARFVGREDVDVRLARVVLVSHPDRFISADRKWTVRTRFGSPEHTIDRNVEDTIRKCGVPVSIGALAAEMAAIYERPKESFQATLSRLLSDRERYFPADGNSYGLTEWLLNIQSETEEDVLFDNYLTSAHIAEYEDAAANLDPANIDTAVAFLETVNRPVPTKVLQFLLWRRNVQKFDPARSFAQLFSDGRAVYLSGGLWIGPTAAAALAARFADLAEREVDEYGDTAAAEVSEPLVISDEEREELIQHILRSETASRASRLLEEIFEISPGAPTYEGDLQTIINTLRADDRVLWVGADRFLTKGAVPSYVYTVPEILRFPELHYTDAEGNEVDLELEDDGFNGGLQREILNVLAQDVLDEEQPLEPEKFPPVTARCVLKFHHKEIGTLPLCQLAPGFFAVEPNILQVEVILPTSAKIEVWVNNETRLVYGLLDWYRTLPVDSGAVFYIERQTPDRYIITYGEETEPSMFISRNRVNELVELGNRADAEQLPTFDIVREITEHYRKGIEYLTLLTEVNIARRTRRRLVASILSAYHCFFQRGGSWVFDAKKLSQGFDKSKRKYLKK